jgi:hypothetical protein
MSIILWYRSADAEKQDGGALREEIRGLSEALMETEV